MVYNYTIMIYNYTIMVYDYRVRKGRFTIIFYDYILTTTLSSNFVNIIIFICWLITLCTLYTGHWT